MASQTSVGILFKDPNETRTYFMDWSADLSVDEITESVWTLADGLTLEGSSVLSGNTMTSVTISGGDAGETYLCTNRITTTTGNIRERSGTLVLRQQ